MSPQQIKTEDIRVFMKSAFLKAGFSHERVLVFCKTAERLHDYMVANGVGFYTPEIGRLFVQMEFDFRANRTSMIRVDKRAIEVLNMILTGEPIANHVCTKVEKPYPGEIGETVKNYYKHLRSEGRLSESSIRSYSYVLSPFSCYCQMKGISLQDIVYADIVGFIMSEQNTNNRTTYVLRAFFKYLYMSNLLGKDFSLDIQTIKPRHTEKIPSFYKKDEILQLESSIDRNSPIGKRNYAIVKLASRLGLRSSDIALLKFSNIDWEQNIIRLKQDKTGKLIELPLLADVGNALIDYIQNGRPTDDHKIVFLTHLFPHKPLTRGAIYTIVSSKISNAGLDIKGRRHGPHSLRHSLAYNMLGNGSTLGIISNALGHTSVESTMYYLGVDIGRLMECSLAVPPVNVEFYNQRGGLLYD